jgi:pSer/pThr/pTyr-binding forkhead associated (FHA) protein
LENECLTIGRKPGNDIQIDDRAISGHHCQIITILNDSFLEDLESTNGTYVNSRRITKYALRNGDVINLGTHQLQYVNEFADPDSDNSMYEKTMFLQRDPVNATPKLSSSPSAPIWGETKHSKSHAWLEILNGSNKDKNYEIKRTMTTLGKPGGQVAVITNRGHHYVIIGIEADSAGRYPRLNGTPVNGRSMRLSDQDLIEVGEIRMTFHSPN